MTGIATIGHQACRSLGLRSKHTPQTAAEAGGRQPCRVAKHQSCKTAVPILEYDGHDQLYMLLMRAVLLMLRHVVCVT